MSVGRNDAAQRNENALARCHMQCPSDECQSRLRCSLNLSRGSGSEAGRKRASPTTLRNLFEGLSARWYNLANIVRYVQSCKRGKGMCEQCIVSGGAGTVALGGVRRAPARTTRGPIPPVSRAPVCVRGSM